MGFENFGFEKGTAADEAEMKKFSDAWSRGLVKKSSDGTGICPFCGEREEFDLIGLKYHLINYCVEFENTENID